MRDKRRDAPLVPLLATGWSHAHGGKPLKLVPCGWRMTMMGLGIRAVRSSPGKRGSGLGWLAVLWGSAAAVLLAVRVLSGAGPAHVARGPSGAGEGDQAGAAGEPGVAPTWAGVASLVVGSACESWGKLARVCVLFLCVAGAALAWWLVAPLR